MSAQTALIIDDEPDIRELVSITISRLGLECYTAANLDEARNVLSQSSVDVCLTDMRLPDGNGVDFVKYMQEQYPQIPVAVITAHGNMDAAVTAMKNGAFDFVSKPVDLKLLRKLVEAAAKTSAVPETSKSVNSTSTGNIQTQKTPSDTEEMLNQRLLGNSPPMKELKRLILKLAKSQAPVLINGESGTGKELVARLIHDCGPRADKPFVPVNCGAIPAELMESEFFGHKKGSFTGAHEDKIGLFQAAEDGTLFLDEVAELPLFMQVKLLRVIQEKAVKPVGATHETSVNVRILSASYKDIQYEVDEARFRHDLYYRLNVIGIDVPPLRERASDIPGLAKLFLKNFAIDNNSNQILILSNSALQKLKNHPFSGNVRELENILHRAVTLADAIEITDEDLQLKSEYNHLPNTTSPKRIEQPGKSLADIEKQKIIDTLDKTRWNRNKAARELGLTYRQLSYRMKKMGIVN